MFCRRELWEVIHSIETIKPTDASLLHLSRPDFSSGRRAAALVLLNRRVRYAAKGAKHAAVARLRAQQLAATLAFVEILAGIGRHGFQLFESLGRAGDFRAEDYASLTFIRIQG
jgi:hypothetical protein